MIKLLPTNCFYTIKILKEKQNLSKIGDKFDLSEYNDSVVVYEQVLPYIFKKCGYNALQFVGVLESVIKNPDQKKKLNELRNGKRYVATYIIM